MAKKDPRVTSSIARSAPFARPILRHLRAVVHTECPLVTETIQWRMPAFVREGNLCLIAAFRAHVGMVFWQGRKVVPLSKRKSGAMGQFGRITSIADLPARGVLMGYVRKAAELDEHKARRATPRSRASAALRAAPRRPGARKGSSRAATTSNPGTRHARRRAAR